MIRRMLHAQSAVLLLNGFVLGVADAERAIAERLAVARAATSPTVPTGRLDDCYIAVPKALGKLPPPQSWPVPPRPPQIGPDAPRNRAERRALQHRR